MSRVIKSGGTLLIRSNFTDRFPELWWYKYFPKARDADISMYESLDTVLSRFAEFGWDLVALDEIQFISAASRHEDFIRLQSRALFFFEDLSQRETTQGFSATS
jgi:hypothetical protein